MIKQDGGPAFPATLLKQCTNPNCRYMREVLGFDNGMNLRDYFAAKAMQGYLFSHVQASDNPSMCAQWAYEQADAMLKERENPYKPGK